MSDFQRELARRLAIGRAKRAAAERAVEVTEAHVRRVIGALDSVRDELEAMGHRDFEVVDGGRGSGPPTYTFRCADEPVRELSVRVDAPRRMLTKLWRARRLTGKEETVPPHVLPSVTEERVREWLYELAEWVDAESAPPDEGGGAQVR